MYEIQTKNDMLMGTSLIITISEDDLDKKALYTIMETKPEFILPFQTRYIDGQVEFVYQIKALCKLQYIAGDYTTKEYVRLWTNVLTPLLECDDWFMKTQSFVLDIEHLYCDKDKKTVSYVYIPTTRDCSSNDFKEMAEELAKQIPVADVALENKVLRAIMSDFNPGDFLNMLEQHMLQSEPCVSGPRASEASVKLKPVEKIPIEPLSAKEPSVELQMGAESYDEATQSVEAFDSVCGFRLVGSPRLPNMIRVQIEDGEVFTIGRYDATVGKQQSSFEFDRKTKAISRRHAAVKRHSDTYNLIDLSSSAGTYVDGQKLPPSTPFELMSGMRVSFGTAGADYVWENGVGS